MNMRTYGGEPVSFQLEENGECYYVGSEMRWEDRQHWTKAFDLFDVSIHRLTTI